jgi:hypothetical protein
MSDDATNVDEDLRKLEPKILAEYSRVLKEQYGLGINQGFDSLSVLTTFPPILAYLSIRRQEATLARQAEMTAAIKSYSEASSEMVKDMRKTLKALHTHSVAMIIMTAAIIVLTAVLIVLEVRK